MNDISPNLDRQKNGIDNRAIRARAQNADPSAT